MVRLNVSPLKSTMVEQSSNILRVGVLLISAMIIYLRRPSFFLEPRLWAEEGVVYFSYAHAHVWYEALIKPHLGYFALWPNLASTIAANLVPLIYVPLITTFFAFAVQLVPITLILWGQSELWQHPVKKIAGIFIILFTPLTNEIWLNTINSQFYFSVITFLILLNETNNSPFRKWFSRALLLCAGLTGVISCFLTPLFFLKAWWEYKRERLVQACILAICTVIQLVVLWVSIRRNILPPRDPVLDMTLFVSVLWTQSISMLLFGRDIAIQFAELIRLTQANLESFELTGLLLLFTEIIFFLYISSKLAWQQRLILVGSFFLLIILSIMGSLGSESDKYRLILPDNGARYFYGPNVVLMFLLLANIEWRGNIPDRIRSGFFAILLVIALTLGVLQYQKFRDFTDSGPEWTEEISRWEKDQTYPIKIWPSNWEIKLSPSQ